MRILLAVLLSSAALISSLPGLAIAGPLIGIGQAARPAAGPALIAHLYGSAPEPWRKAIDSFFRSPTADSAIGLEGTLPSLKSLYLSLPEESRGLSPLLGLLEQEEIDPELFLEQSPEGQGALLHAAVRVVRSQLRAEAAFLAREAVSGQAGESEPLLLAGRLYMLKTALPMYLAQEELAAVARLRLASGNGELSPGPPIETLPAFPALGAELPRVRSGLGLRAKGLLLRSGHPVKRLLSRQYRRLLELFRWAMTHAGELYRKYLSGREMDSHSLRWHVIEGLHEKGDFRGSFGHPVHDGAPEILSPLIFPEKAMETIRGQAREIGGARLGPMIGVSGMSFPQLSAQSHLSLLYIHLRLAKELGVRQLLNTGEGGPGFHLAMLEGRRSQLQERIIEWNKAHGQFKDGSWEEARVIHFVQRLMESRDRLFSEFGEEDLRKAQIVAQFGSALNGIRGSGNRVDFEKLRAIGRSPYVAMIQYKLKQAAKRGAKVDPRKVDAIVAALRDIPRDKPFKSPELNPDMDSHESLAALILATRLVTHKPVSIKFGIGDPKDILDFFAFLRDAGALPDHVQLDGRGSDFSPGSGNAPPGANTSLALDEAVIVMDAVLKKLGARDRVFVEATGDVLLPAEGVEKLALGADGIAGARLWMGMGLGLGLDPGKIGPQGYQAAANWWKSYTQTLAETGAVDWRELRKTHGLGSGRSPVRVKAGKRTLALEELYSAEHVSRLLSGVLSPQEVRELLFRR